MPRQTLYSFWGNLSVIEFLDQLSSRFDFVMFSRPSVPTWMRH